MSKTSEDRALARALLERHGRTFAGELGLDLAKNTPAPLFRWLVAVLLLSARISSDLAMRAAEGLAEAGWTTPEKLDATTWKERVTVLNRSGYARFDEKTSTLLGEMTEKLLADYRGDLRRLREEAERDPGGERRLVMEFKGIGEVGADIFFREMQTVWQEHFPFADKAARSAAEGLGLPARADALADLVGDEDLPRLLCAVMRAKRAGEDAQSLLKANA